jgi:hypothetical protein
MKKKLPLFALFTVTASYSVVFLQFSCDVAPFGEAAGLEDELE